MANEMVPEIKEMAFPPLSKALLESVLKRTLEYDCTEHVHAIEAWQLVSGAKVDYRKVMQDIAVLLLGDTWYLISKEPSDNGVPVLVFQKERVNMLLAGASSGGQGMVVVMITAASKPDIAFAGKAIEKVIEKQSRQK
jgi:hypothetical protein